MKSYKSESNHIPPEWDTTSSRIVTFHNHNIEQVERKDPFSEEAEPRIAYIYDVDEYAKDEFMYYMIEKNRADIDYLAIMSEYAIEKYQADIDYLLIMTGV